MNLKEYKFSLFTLKSQTYSAQQYQHNFIQSHSKKENVTKLEQISILSTDQINYICLAPFW